MKKLVFSAALLALGITSVSAGVVSASEAVVISVAQEKKPAPAKKMAQKQAQAMSTELKLTAEQTAKLEAAILERITKSREATKKHGDDKKAAKADIKAAAQAFKAQLKTILTAEQFAQHNAAEAAKAKDKKKKA